jgi:single-stranded-DNA-specific exonuclease
MSLKGTSGKIWKLRGSDLHKKKKDINNIISVLLENRGIVDKKEREFFLNPPHPSKLTLLDFGLDEDALKKVVSKIKEAKNEKKLIIIYGDYDADGITGTAILWEALYSRGFDVLPYLPDRAKDGYGIRSESVEKLKKKYPNLGMIISVDNGIVAFDEVKRIKEMGIDVVITDHHKKDEKYPPADVVVHTDKISGAGVSWVLSQYIRKKIKPKKASYDNDGLDLLVIGTVADQMSLIGVNRSIVKYGIKAINETKRKGLLEIFKEAGLKKGKIGVYEINYSISPRINAMGRISHALESLRLLCTKDQKKARDLALHLGRVNKERQKMVDEVLNQVRLKAQKDLDKNKVIIVSGNDYNEGIIGLVAGKLVEEFYKPVIVISQKEDYSKASGRSVSGFDITKHLRKIGHFFESLGGHTMACGFSIRTDKISDFRKEFVKYVNRVIKSELLVPKLLVDLEIGFENIDERIFDVLGLFEPFGVGNPSPLFLTRSVKVVKYKLIGNENKHLRLVLESSGKFFEAVGFGLGPSFDIEDGKDLFLDMVFSIDKNTWNGIESIQLNIKDFRISDGRKISGT